jgi:hypothetical protein
MLTLPVHEFTIIGTSFAEIAMATNLLPHTDLPVLGDLRDTGRTKVCNFGDREDVKVRR